MTYSHSATDPHTEQHRSFANRRNTGELLDTAPAISLGDLRIEPDALRVVLAGNEVDLTVQEFDLLLLLARQAGKPVSQEELAAALWQGPAEEHYRHLSVVASRLRGKLAASRFYRVQAMRKRGYGLMLPSINRIEEIKLVKDGLDVFDDILRYARTGGEIDADDIERMKWYGVFHRRQTPGYFMQRLRVPNGILTSGQITEIGRLANQYGRGDVDITMRQNFQIRWLRIHDVPDVLTSLDSAGLEYRQSGMDSVRNITGCSIAGLDPDELIDASPLCQALQDAVVGRKEFSNLPRKFNISISGCRHDCATSQIHDLSLTPAIKDGVIGFNVRAGGAMGGRNPGLAVELDVFVTPEQAVPLCLAAIELFRDEGTREDRREARVKWLIEQWGVQRYRDELERRLGPLQRAGVSQLIRYGGDHVGVAPQKLPGLYAVGCLVPVGRIRGDDLIEFGQLAETYGNGEVRLTNNQNLLMVNVDGASLPKLLAEPLLARYSPQPSAWMRRSVSCTGKDFCHFAQIDTKSSAVAFAHQMDELLPMSSALRVHWSGCVHGCGHHAIGDVGFEATRINVAGQMIDAADIYMGGRLGDEPQLATKVMDAVPLTDLPRRVAELLRERGLA